MHDAQAVIADEDSQPRHVAEVSSKTSPELVNITASFWSWNGQMISTTVLREWLRRRANRSEDAP